MAYSSGFNPHPRISYANASPTGAATHGEYLEIGLNQVVEAAEIRDRLRAAMPPGLEIVEVVKSDRSSLTEVLTASRWRVELDPVGEGDIDQASLERAVEALMTSPSHEVSRMTKTGLRTFDVREAIVEMSVTGPATLEILSRHTTPLVRPDDVVRALRQLEPGLDSARPPMLTRLEQGTLDGSELRSVMGVDA